MLAVPDEKNVLDLFRLDGRVAYVTGGGQGLGEAMAMALAQAGSKVAIVDINPNTAEKVAERIRGLGGQAISIKTDVTKVAEVESMVQNIVAKFGRIDIGVNNAGTGDVSPVEETSEENWKRVVDVNLNSVFLCAREAGRQMIRQGQGGCIINTASMSGTIINKGSYLASYCATKAAVKHLTKALAVEWVKYGIRANSISPGYMSTPMIAKSLEDPVELARMTGTTPIGRVGQPRELAGAVVFLASEAATFVTGHDLIIDGGHTVW